MGKEYLRDFCIVDTRKLGLYIPDKLNRDQKRGNGQTLEDQNGQKKGTEWVGKKRALFQEHVKGE